MPAHRASEHLRIWKCTHKSRRMVSIYAKLVRRISARVWKYALPTACHSHNGASVWLIFYRALAHNVNMNVLFRNEHRSNTGYMACNCVLLIFLPFLGLLPWPLSSSRFSRWYCANFSFFRFFSFLHNVCERPKCFVCCPRVIVTLRIRRTE